MPKHSPDAGIRGGYQLEARGDRSAALVVAPRLRIAALPMIHMAIRQAGPMAADGPSPLSENR